MHHFLLNFANLWLISFSLYTATGYISLSFANVWFKKFLPMGRSWVAVEQTLKFLPLARVRNDIVYEPEASRQCHSLREQEEEISMSARLPPRNDIVSIYVKPPLNKWVNYLLNRCFGPLRKSRYIYIFTLIYNSASALTFVAFFCQICWVYFTFFHIL